MPSKTDVMNRALGRIGVKQITAPTDTSPEARAVNAAWDMVRDEVMRDHPWNCIAARAVLPELATDPAFGFGKQYQVPAESLRILSVIDLNTSGPSMDDWVVEGQSILTDITTSISIRYLKRELDPNLWDTILVSAVAARLAAEVCIQLNGNRSERNDQMALYQRILTRAKMADAQEQSPMELTEDNWIDVRV